MAYLRGPSAHGDTYKCCDCGLPFLEWGLCSQHLRDEHAYESVSGLAKKYRVRAGGKGVTSGRGGHEVDLAKAIVSRQTDQAYWPDDKRLPATVRTMKADGPNDQWQPATVQAMNADGTVTIQWEKGPVKVSAWLVDMPAEAASDCRHNCNSFTLASALEWSLTGGVVSQSTVLVH